MSGFDFCGSLLLTFCWYSLMFDVLIIGCSNQALMLLFLMAFVLIFLKILRMLARIFVFLFLRVNLIMTVFFIYFKSSCVVDFFFFFSFLFSG